MSSRFTDLEITNCDLKIEKANFPGFLADLEITICDLKFELAVKDKAGDSRESPAQ